MISLRGTAFREEKWTTDSSGILFQIKSPPVSKHRAARVRQVVLMGYYAHSNSTEIMLLNVISGKVRLIDKKQGGT